MGWAARRWTPRMGTRMPSYFANVRRAGFDIGLSAGKLTRFMVDILLQLPPDAPLTKEAVVLHIGPLAAMSRTRDVASAWTQAKRQVARDHPDRFCLDGKILRRPADVAARPRLEKLSPAGQRKLAALAAAEGLTPDELVTRLIAAWRAARR